MMRSSIYHAVEQMNSLEKQADRYDDKAWDKQQAGNEKSANYYERKAEDIRFQIKGYKDCLKTLGLDAWIDNHGEWHIPLDDIERVC